MERLLENKVAIVTGGARGIGEAIVRKFTEHGASVSILDRDESLGTKLASELVDMGFNVAFQSTELEDENQVRESIEQTGLRFGGIDILVNNAGANDFVGLQRTPSEFRRSLERNLVHYFTTAHYTLPYLISSQGSIINVASKVALMGEGGTSGYAAAKGGILGLTKEWALDLADRGIRVNAIVPAQVLTPQGQEFFASSPENQALKRHIEGSIPLGRRFTNPDEVANFALFLASGLSSHTTGTEIYPTGGYLLDPRFLKQ